MHPTRRFIDMPSVSRRIRGSYSPTSIHLPYHSLLIWSMAIHHPRQRLEISSPRNISSRPSSPKVETRKPGTCSLAYLLSSYNHPKNLRLLPLLLLRRTSRRGTITQTERRNGKRKKQDASNDWLRAERLERGKLPKKPFSMRPVFCQRYLHQSLAKRDQDLRRVVLDKALVRVKALRTFRKPLIYLVRLHPHDRLDHRSV
jgi:hypothetical protein